MTNREEGRIIELGNIDTRLEIIMKFESGGIQSINVPLADLPELVVRLTGRHHLSGLLGLRVMIERASGGRIAKIFTVFSIVPNTEDGEP